MKDRVRVAAIKVLSHVDSMNEKGDIVNNIIKQTKLKDRTFMIKLLGDMRDEGLIKEEIQGRKHIQKVTNRGFVIIYFLRAVKSFHKASREYRRRVKARFSIPINQWPELQTKKLRYDEKTYLEMYHLYTEDSAEFEYDFSHWFLKAIYKKYIELMEAFQSRPISDAIITFVLIDGINNHIQSWKDGLAEMNKGVLSDETKEVMLSRLLGRDDHDFLSLIDECSNGTLNAMPGLENERKNIGNDLSAIYQPDDLLVEEYEAEMRGMEDQANENEKSSST